MTETTGHRPSRLAVATGMLVALRRQAAGLAVSEVLCLAAALAKTSKIESAGD